MYSKVFCLFGVKLKHCFLCEHKHNLNCIKGERCTASAISQIIFDRNFTHLSKTLKSSGTNGNSTVTLIRYCSFLSLRYALRNKNEDDVCEELVLKLTDTLNRELSGVGPEDVLSESQLEVLRSGLEQQVSNGT